MQSLRRSVVVVLSLLVQAAACQAALPSVTVVPAFVGGLKVDEIEQCMHQVSQQCAAIKPLAQYLSCARGLMEKEDFCQQNLALLTQERGFFGVIKQYKQVSVVHATVLAADHSAQYFMIDTQGELVEPTAELPINSLPNYAEIVNNYPRVELWGVAYSFPHHQHLPNGGERLVFQQMLLNGCYACEQAGIAKVAYDFSPQGKFINAKVLHLVPYASDEFMLI